MVYWTTSRNETTRRDFDPYELSLVDDGWYVFGYCHKAAEIRQFAVQRVRLVKETGETFDRPADFRAENYMKGSFRAMRGDGEYAVASAIMLRNRGFRIDYLGHAQSDRVSY